MLDLNGLADEIKKACLDGKRGALLISDGHNNGKVFVINGAVVNLEFEHHTGKSALITISDIKKWSYAIFVTGQIKPSRDTDLPETDELLRSLRAAAVARDSMAREPPGHGVKATGLPPPDKLREIIRIQLAQSLGPVANIIVNKQHDRIAALRTKDELDKLLWELAAKISDSTAAGIFLSAVNSQLKT